LSNSSRPLRIGITGPIGCGKSTIAGWLRELGAVTIDADEVAREVVEPGGGLDAVIGEFGEAVRAADGSLDRSALGRIVFADPEALRRLEAIVHPAVRPRIEARLRDAATAAAPAVVIEAIKLVEGGLAALCDEVWLVTCPPGEQRERVAERDGNRGDVDAQADAAARILAQGDLTARLRPAADRIIDTGGTLRESRARAEAAYVAALAGAASGGAPAGPGRGGD
jgi:dephospho-CoA kinase